MQPNSLTVSNEMGLPPTLSMTKDYYSACECSYLNAISQPERVENDSTWGKYSHEFWGINFRRLFTSLTYKDEWKMEKQKESRFLLTRRIRNQSEAELNTNIDRKNFKDMVDLCVTS